jgi:hypothetical protein
MDHIREGELECCIFVNARNALAFFREGVSTPLLLADARVGTFVRDIVKAGALPDGDCCKNLELVLGFGAEAVWCPGHVPRFLD